MEGVGPDVVQAVVGVTTGGVGVEAFTQLSAMAQFGVALVGVDADVAFSGIVR